MTPKGKRYKTPSIFQKDLMSYRAAKTNQNQSELEYFGNRLNNSMREASKSLDPNKISGSSSLEMDFSKTMGEGERKGLFFDLERFYRRNNLQVLEEDESPSEEVEHKKSTRMFQLSLDERVGRKDKTNKSQENIQSQGRKREQGLNKMQEKEKNIVSNLEALMKKAPLSQFQTEKTEQPKIDKRMTPEKLKGSFKGLKSEAKKEKESPEKSKQVVSKEPKKGQSGILSIEGTPQKSQKVTKEVKETPKEEQPKQEASSDLNKSNVANEPFAYQVPQPSASNSPSKKLHLNNLSKQFPVLSPILSSKNSPTGRPKASSAANTKRAATNGTPKGNDYKSIMSYKTTSKFAATIPSVVSGGSTNYTGSFGESENHTTPLTTNENGAESPVKVEKMEKAEKLMNDDVSLIENKKKMTDFSQTWTAGSLEAAIKAKQMEVEALKALLEQENQGKFDLGTLRVDTNTSESERNSQRKVIEKESPVGKQAIAMTKDTEGVSSKKVFSGQIQSAYGSYALNQIKKTYGTIPIKHSLEKGPLHSKDSVERHHDKTPPRQPRKNSGVSGLTTATTSTNTTTSVRKSSEAGINVVNVATSGLTTTAPTTQSGAKLKSPTNNNYTMKNIKLPESGKEQKSPIKEIANKKSMSLQSKDLREMQLKKKNTKEIRSSKNSREWNINEVKGMITEKYTIVEPQCSIKLVTHTEGCEQELESSQNSPRDGFNGYNLDDKVIVHKINEKTSGNICLF